MAVLGRTNHAFLFDGVSDSIIIPQGRHTKLGDLTPDGKTMSTLLSSNPSGSQTSTLTSGLFGNQFCIEAWVQPDCGGVIVQKENQFSLSIGNVDTPGPAVFTVTLSRPTGVEVVRLSTAVEEDNGYDGTVYPPSTFGGPHDSYNRFNSSYDDATSLNVNHRPLIHVVAALRKNDAVLYINGELMVQRTLRDSDFTLNKSDHHIFVGGKGGQFRGIMEGLHLSNRFTDALINRNAPLVDDNTLVLYRFEEPIAPVQGSFEINPTFSTVSGLTKILFATASDAASLATTLTGKTVTSGTVDFTASPYSMGNYKVFDAHTTPGTTTTRDVAHVPYNLLINAGSVNPKTKKPNQKPPERVRLHSINDIDSTPYMLVSSIHIDFVNGDANGLRTTLHTRTDDVDDFFVVVGSDLLIDSGTGSPYQPLHYSTQMIDRTGQMIIDEGPYDNHGIVYSSRMSTTDVDTNNPFAVAWDTSAIDEKFKIGHSGRHSLNHVDGHPFLRMLPDPSEEIINQTIDAGVDTIDVYYDAALKGVEDQIGINTRVDILQNTGDFTINKITSTSEVNTIVGNGLPTGSREIIAIGGSALDILPFMLRGPVPTELPSAAADIDSETRRYHLRPSRNSRVAILHVPTLSSSNLAPFVEVHYNAIDISGKSMEATGESGTATPYLMVEKTVPAGVTPVGGGSTVYDIINTAIGSGNLTLHAPGGYIEVAMSNSDFNSVVSKPNSLIGDTSEGYESDDELDERFTPFSDGVANYTPRSDSSAQPNTPPKIVTASHTTSDDHESVFHRMLINTVSNSKQNTLTDKTIYSRREPSTVVSSPSDGEFDSGSTSSNTHIHELFDVIDNHPITESHTSNMRIYLQPSDRRRTNQMTHLRSTLDEGAEPNVTTLLYHMSRARVRSVEERESNGVKSTVIQCRGLSEAAVSRTVSKTGTGSPDSHIVKEIEPNAPVVTVTLGGPGQGASDIKPTYDPSPLSRLPFSTQRGYHVRSESVTYTTAKVATLNVKPINNESPNMASWGTYGFAKKGRVYLDDGASALYDSKDGTSFTFTDQYSSSCDVAGSAVISNIASGTSNLVVGMFINNGGFTNARIQSIDSSSQVTADTSTSVTATGVTITFTHTVNSSSQTQRYLDANGINYGTFDDWLKSTGKASNVTLGATADPMTVVLSSEPDFGTESLSEDGSTVNDRMFQGGGKDVNHDYQLGTQYASTRALVEIPIFTNQVFDDDIAGVFPGPDNSLRLSVDATYTAHTWNPTPVGRRPGSSFNSDRAKHSAYALAVSKRSAGRRAFITKSVVVDGDNLQLHVSDISIFPSSSAVSGAYTEKYQGIDNRPRFRRVYLESGAWALYTEANAGGYLVIPDGAVEDNDWSMTKQFRREYRVGMPVFLSGGLPSESLVPIGDEPYTPSVAYENRSEHYHDTASVRTQGGNVDYGLRQYVSAVEFKAGPESNPHAARIVPKRASGVISTVRGFVDDNDGSDGMGIAIVSLTSDEDFSTFPDFGFDSQTSLDFTVGDFLYEVELDDAGTTRRLHYYGRIRTADSHDVPANSIALGFYNPSGTTVPSYLTAGNRITLSRRSRAILNFDRSNISAINDASILDEEYDAYCIEATGWTATVVSGNSTLTLASTATTPLTSNTLGPNLRKGDHIFIKDITGELNPIGIVSKMTTRDLSGATDYTVTLTANSAVSLSGTLFISFSNAFVEDPDAILNRTWVYPYASGGFRNGDTVWSNMTLNNPHAMEGLFAKSRGVLNEARVWKGFTGGAATLTDEPRSSVPLENFLIGKTCIETAQNFAQHVNKTIEENYKALGLSASDAPTVAYVDPYLADDDHARVLLYDVAHDREFIAFQDIFMQVQTSAKAVEIGWPRKFIKDGSLIDLAEYVATNTGGGPSWATTQIDVANGFPSQNPYLRSTQQSKFIESAYAHDVANRIGTDVLTPLSGSLPSSMAASSTSATSPSIYGKAHGHHSHTGYSLSGGLADYALGDSSQMRTSDEAVLPLFATIKHEFSRIRSFEDLFVTELKKLRKNTSNASLREPSTFHDTPDGTRVIPAFLALKGIRANDLDLTSHEESRLQHLPHWKQMEFIRRLDIDVGALALAESVTDIESAAHEMVRIINQAGAPKAKRVLDANTTGSAHDPAPWWDAGSAFESSDRGTHMGYLRAHIGRQVQDLDGNPGYTVVIHSTVPGASGRNFCVWLDNSKGQTPYRPQFIVGHGGRWRNFWGMPDEIENENMHPAPLPLNKHGRPFAPITTLHQLIDAELTGMDSVPSLDFSSRDNNTESPVLRAISNAVGGSGSNTVAADSFEPKSTDKSLVEGLRTGTNAVGRVNFGGLAKAGVPGWSPVAGQWGMGPKGDDTFARRYGNYTITTYGDYVPAADIKEEKFGTSPIYGIRLTDHKGVNHTVRLIYRQMGQPFANENTILPSTIEDEVCVFFDDRTNSQGGFTIGEHMVGQGDATGRMTGLSGDTEKTFYGGKWNPVDPRDVAIKCDVTYLHASKTIKVDFVDPYDTSSTLTHPDILGYLGFPKRNGRVQITDSAGNGNTGLTLSYTSRSTNDASGEHRFQGIESEFTSDQSLTARLISPTINWTTLITDELIAAATAAAINNHGINDPEGVVFDCRDMYATNGQTFGELGVRADAIRIRAFNPDRFVRPIAQFFTASLHPDFGIKAAHIEYGEVEKTDAGSDGVWSFGTSRANTDSNIDAGRDIDCGYVPYTLLQVTSRARGTNTNTRTPVLIDSFNEEVNGTLIEDWSRNLRGSQFTDHSGDHITPYIDNPMLRYTSLQTGNNEMYIATNTAEDELWGFLAPATISNGTVPSFGERRRIYLWPEASAVVSGHSGSDGGGKTNLETLIWETDSESDDWDTALSNNSDGVVSHYGDLKRSILFDGLRSLGSVDSSPIHHFRGGRSSIDKCVPIFFGGGFSGVVLDVNDGTMNDYSEFYTHPYATGPTGVSGIQNANEIVTSHAILDANAMLAFFPGTALLNQHRGSIMPPAHNRDNVLSPDLDSGSGTINSSHPNSAPYTAGVVVQKPSPLVLRFAHPTARYDDHITSTENKTTYIIFGPGQPFPFTQEVADSSDMTGADSVHPHTGAVLTIGNTWSKVPGNIVPNPIENQDGNYMPEDADYHNAYHAFQWRTPLNWEPATGKPLSLYSKIKQRPENGRMYGQYFNDSSISPSSSFIASDLTIRRGMPLRHNPLLGFGIAMGADMVWHMDGGYHPGGHWMDNQIAVNPSHPDGDTTITPWGPSTQVHPTAFRVAGMLTTKVLGYTATEGQLVAADVDSEYIIVDATRCQNSEELATVVGAAINTFPGKGALKAMGGTHMPSMGNAMRQDRYGWVELETFSAYQVSTDPYYVEYSSSTHTTQDELEQIPACGWIKSSTSGSADVPAWGCYHSREVFDDSGTWKVRFYLAPNRITNSEKFESYVTLNDGSTAVSSLAASGGAAAGSIYVWSKAGVHRFNNVGSTTRDHMCQVHFSGLVDAVDRTRPIGAVGWHGERYSYLNSLRVDTEGYGAGLGAWHGELGFSPYGSASSVLSGFGGIPTTAPLPRSPESTPPVDGIGSALMTYINNPYSSYTYTTNTLTYARKDTDDDAPHTLHAKPSHYDIADTFPEELVHPQGLFSKAFIVIACESEFALIAKRDRDSSTCVGDMLMVKGQGSPSLRYAGTTRWDERFHGQDRFIAPAHAGPNVEALIVDDTALETDSIDTGTYTFHTGSVTDLRLENATPDRAKTGDLVTDLDFSLGSKNLESGITAERNVVPEFYTSGSYTTDGDFPTDFWKGDILAYDLYKRSSALNFSTEHVVWKRMDGGNLSLPSLNARGLGAVPWTTRVASSTAYTSGEKLYGNVRFSFETTNSAMMPVLQAQELSHPQLAERHEETIGGILTIPNEEMQFDEVTVIDDSGQEHTLQGGSPLGTVIRSFMVLKDRGVEGNAPALANSGNTPSMMVQLPDPDTIPGNIVVRSGFDPVQAYQTESFGSGGMLHADLSQTHTGHLFDSSVSSPRKGPTYEDHNWEHIDVLSNLSKTTGWKEATDSNPLKLSYELHDRSLFFHVTKMGHSHTHRYPTTYTHANGVENQALNISSWDSSTSVLTMDATINTRVYDASFGTKEVKDDRRFIRILNPTTDESVVASYTGISGTTFTGVVGDVDFTAFMAAQTHTDLDVVPSYYVPAGSARFFAAQRLRDHAEVSGASPDMAHTHYRDGDANTLAHTRYTKPQLTPMPFPRMGHHYVTPTMPMLPGHWAHPAYQSIFKRHLAERASTKGYRDRDLFNEEKTTTSVSSDISTDVTDYMSPLEPELFFSGVSAPVAPSDIHGGAFTLMFETKVKWDGYGVLGSRGHAGIINKAGGHSIVLEAANNYTLQAHFPDPKEVGAYQIVIQPNVFNTQLVGYHLYSSTQKLTGQQVNTVIGTEYVAGVGALVLYLSDATQADVRGCEVFINEVILDHDADFGKHFTNIPPLSLYNAFGIELTESPSFTRRAFPYTPMMSKATPGYTLNIPWWSILHSVAPDDGNSSGFRHLSQYTPYNYYEFSRNTLGSIGMQITLGGYPSIYPDIYSHILQNTSLSPKCTVISTSGSSPNIEITVDDASLFPETPYYNHKLEYTDSNGKRQVATYTRRSGLQSGTVNEPKTFTGVTTTGTISAGMELRLTRAYDNLPAKDVFTDTSRSIITKILPQLKKGTRDTVGLHVPDAFLCMWHPNLGRPYTFYSDSSRTWGGTTTDRAVDAAQYNIMPDHFQTIHYHDVVYSMSHGPFDLRIKTPDDGKDGSVVAADADHDQAGQDQASNYIMLNRFWPCGTRGGPQSSRPDAFMQAAASWIVPRAYASDDLYRWKDNSTIDASYSRSSGIVKEQLATASTHRLPYGYRIAVRQACNRPRWGLIPTRAILEDALSGISATTVGHRSGPLVQLETRTWTYAGGDTDSNSTFPNTYVGVMERLTNFSAMLGMDKYEFQVRHSDGRRMTRPFGSPVRTLRNSNKIERDWWGDTEGKAITRLSEAAQYYLVDWWGNTRGEDVRRAPVRGFGIRPAWDCGDAYEYDRTNGRTPFQRVYNNGKPIFNLKNVVNSSGEVSVTSNFTIPRFGGRLNSDNTNVGTVLVDVFAPTNALRVGDMGNGRGVRYPTMFNEDVLTDLSTPIHTTGLVLSHNTAEPLFGDGLIRPRNDVLQADEVKRGISARLGVAEDGLLKPEAVVSDRVEQVVGDSPHKDAISRTSPRIGVDAENFEELEKPHIIINTEAHSLHTDRNVGQRTVLQGAHMPGNQSLVDANYNTFSFSDTNGTTNSVLKFSHTSNMRPMGGDYILEARAFAGLFDDTGWGVTTLTGSNKTSNPYQDVSTYSTDAVRNNDTDSIVRFLLRPNRVLDRYHVEMYRPKTTAVKQSDGDYFQATAGGKYGIFTYEATGRTPSANVPDTRSTPDTKGPYIPIVYIDNATNEQVPTSPGPNLGGVAVTNFNTSLTTTVCRLITSENTLQHHRSDAPRRRTAVQSNDPVRRKDFSIKPRYSQTLHPKGHKGDVTFGTSDHSGDAA